MAEISLYTQTEAYRRINKSAYSSTREIARALLQHVLVTEVEYLDKYMPIVLNSEKQNRNMYKESKESS